MLPAGTYICIGRSRYPNISSTFLLTLDTGVAIVNDMETTAIIEGMLIAAEVAGVQYVLVSDGVTDDCLGYPTYKDINSLTEDDKNAAKRYVLRNPVRA
jgi:hypothetical protein